MPNGLTESQMVERMYTELVGLDGKSGLVKDVAETKKKVGYMETVMVTRPQCAAIRKNAGDRKDKVLMRIKDLLLMAAAIAGFLFGSGILKGLAP